METILNTNTTWGAEAEKINNNFGEITYLNKIRILDDDIVVSSSNIFVDGIERIELYGANNYKKYYFKIFQKQSTTFQIYVADAETEEYVCRISLSGYTAPEGVDTLVLAEVNASGMTGKILMNWDKVIDDLYSGTPETTTINPDNYFYSKDLVVINKHIQPNYSENGIFSFFNSNTISLSTSEDNITRSGKSKILPISRQKRYFTLGTDAHQTSNLIMYQICNKYGAKLTVNIPVPITDDVTEEIATKNIVEGGHELGFYGNLFNSKFEISPAFNGYDASNPDGSGQTAFPPSTDFTADAGSGLNAFGYDINSVIGTKAAGLYADILWKDLTESQIQAIRDSCSILKQTIIDVLDNYSNRYLGTTGSSVGSWVTNQYTGGIFSGCKTSENHEIWERIIEIYNAYFITELGIVDNIYEWSSSGGGYHALTYPDINGIRYYDSAKTKKANSYAKFDSSRLTLTDGSSISRSFVNVLESYGITHTHDLIYRGRTVYDGDVIRHIQRSQIFNAQLSKEKFSDYCNAIVLWLGTVYSESDFSAIDDWLSWLYDNDAIMRDQINKFADYSARGIVMNGLWDTSTSAFTNYLNVEYFLAFCFRAGVIFLSKSERHDLCHNVLFEEGNLITNPNFDRITSCLTVSNLPTKPDGWNSGLVIENYTDIPDKVSRAIETNAAYAYLPIYGVPLGKLRFSCYALGDGNIEILYIRNKDKSDFTDFLSYDQAAISTFDNSAYEKLTIDFFIEDEQIIEGGISDLNGYDNKICGIIIKINGVGNRVTMPYLRKLRTDEF